MCAAQEPSDGRGSSLRNGQEVEAVVDMVKRFLDLGMELFAIGVMIGYRRQYDALIEFS